MRHVADMIHRARKVNPYTVKSVSLKWTSEFVRAEVGALSNLGFADVGRVLCVTTRGGGGSDRGTCDLLLLCSPAGTMA